MNNYIDIIIKNKKELKGKSFTVDNTPVKVIGIGPQALKVLYPIKSKFQNVSHMDQTWFKYENETKELKELIKKMVNSID